MTSHSSTTLMPSVVALARSAAAVLETPTSMKIKCRDLEPTQSCANRFLVNFPLPINT
jgi:hypothetical protein